MRIFVKVIPKSRRQEAIFDKNVIKVWLRSAPEGGRANEELVEILANIFKIRKSDVTIHAGFSSKKKIVDIVGLTTADLAQISQKGGTGAGV